MLMVVVIPIVLDGQSVSHSYGIITRWNRIPGLESFTTCLPLAPDSGSFIAWDAPSKRIALVRTLADSFSIRMLHPPHRFIGLYPAPDRASDALALIRPSPPALVEVTLTSADSLIVENSTPLVRAPRRAAFADLNLDGKTDVLLFDEEEPGMMPLFRTGAGGWRKGRPITPDLPVKSVAALHLNNDGIVDLLAFDWVTNSLHLLFGVGRERYLDQGSVSVEGSCDEIFVDPVSAEHSLRVTLYDRSAGTLTHLETNELGDLQAVARSEGIVSVGPLLAFHDTTTSSTTFVAVSESLLTTVTDPFVLTSPVVRQIGLPGRARAFAPMPEREILIFLSDGSIIELSPFSRPSVRRDSLTVAVGLRPVGIVGGDFNVDGNQDVLVIGSGPGSMSFLWGEGTGSFAGMDIYGIDPGATAGAPGAFRDSIQHLYVTYGAAGIVSAIAVNIFEQSVVVSNIPSRGPASVLGEFVTSRGTAAFSAVGHAQTASATLATYERIDEESFLEESFAIGPPSVLYGATLGSVDGDGKPDVVFVYRPDDSSAITLGVLYADTTHASRRFVGTELPVNDVRRCFLWVSDVERDSIPDVIAVFPRATQKLYLLRSTAESLFVRPILIDTLVRIDDRSRFHVEDADGDGYPDLLAIVRARGGLGWWRNRGDGSFLGWELLVGAPDFSAFVLIDLDEDGVQDICATREKGNTVEVRNGRSLSWGWRR